MRYMRHNRLQQLKQPHSERDAADKADGMPVDGQDKTRERPDPHEGKVE